MSDIHDTLIMIEDEREREDKMNAIEEQPQMSDFELIEELTQRVKELTELVEKLVKLNEAMVNRMDRMDTAKEHTPVISD